MPCTKVKLSKKEAEAVINRIYNSYQHRKEKRAYLCNICNYWHTTSEDKRITITSAPIVYKDRWNKLLIN